MAARILIVEDDAPLSNAVRSALERGGYEVDAAADGSAALRMLTTRAYDVVLLDIGLPFIDGWRILAGMEPGHVPSVIVISARREERDKVRALDMGADDYLRPFVRRLRRRLEADPHDPRVIVTVGVRGYRLGPPSQPG